MRSVISLLIYSFQLLPLFAQQQENLKFSYYDVGDGLLSSEITSIVQDKEGFLWIGSLRGLNRFNGFEFEDFGKLIVPDKYLPVRSLLADRDGVLWIATENSGLIKYTPVSNELVVYSFSENKNLGLPDNFVSDIFIDNNNELWIGSWFGLSFFNKAEEKFYHYPFETPKSKSIYNYSVIEKIEEDNYGNLWIATWGGGLHKFNKQTKRFTNYEHLLDVATDQNLWVKDLLIEGETLWIATIGDGLFSMDINKHTVKQYLFYSDNISKGYQRLLSLHRRNPSELWIGCERGLISFNTVNGNYHVLSDTDKKSDGLLSNIVTRIFEDNHKGIWVAAGGLNYYNYGASKFQHFNSSNIKDPSFDNDVQAFLEISKYEVWISTSKGIGIFNPYKTELKMQQIFPGVVHKMLKLNNGKIAAISLRDGLSIYDPTTKRTTNFRYNEKDETGLNSEVILDAVQDNLGNLWLATHNGLSYFKTEINKFVHIAQDYAYSKSLRNKSVVSVELTDDGKLWFFNQRDLFHIEYVDMDYLIHPNTVGYITDTTKYALAFQYATTNARYIKADGNSLWLAGDGLIRYDTHTKLVKSYRREDGLPSNESRQVNIDKHNNIWLTTNNGIAYLNTQTNEITNFFMEDGLQSNRFNGYAASVTNDGLIYVGGNNGFNIINPEIIELNDYLPPTKLSRLLIYNQSIDFDNSNSVNDSKEYLLHRNISYESELILNHNQNVITFEFAALNFLYPHQNEYAYMIEGVDKDWNYVKNRRYASYSNLPEGKPLIFRLKGSNNNGIWNSQETRISIFINPPFWNTWYFKFIVAASLISIAFSVYFIRVKQLKNQRYRLREQVKERTHEIEFQKEEIEKQNSLLLHQANELKIQNSNTILFSEMGKQITSSIELEEIFERIYQLINQVLDTPLLAIGEVNNDGSAIDYWEIYKGHISSQSIPTSQKDRLSIHAFTTNQPIFTNNLKEDIDLYVAKANIQYERDNINSAIYIPLHSPTNNVIGILVVKSEKRNAFDQKNLNLLKNIAVYISIALVNSNTYKKLQEQSKQLKELDRIKTRFYTNISHEFRTPLSLIIGPSEELLKTHAQTVKEKEYLEIILQNSKRLLRLVTQIMDLSKLEDGVLRLETSQGNIVETVKTIAESFRFVAENKSINFSIKSNVKLVEGYFDRDKIEKIVYNLLNNAFKYTHDGGDISIDMQVHKQFNQAENIEINIRDTGIGIGIKDIDNIFQQYYRADNVHTQTQFGAGIGLSLVKKLVDLHRGIITLTSKEGEGSNFTITIPLHESYYLPSEKIETFINNPDALLNRAEPDMTTLEPSILLPSSKRREKILLVEDNSELIHFMQDILSDTYEVLCAANGVEALEVVKSSSPALIVSDVMMDKMNGFELCKRIKQNEDTKHIPVILLTAKNSVQDHLEGLGTGADEYLAKPLNGEQLKLRINNLLATYKNIKHRFENKLIGDIDQLELADNHKEFLRSVVEILENNITNKDINIDLFAHELGVSRTLLYERIKKATGDSLGVFIKTSRLKYAAKLLLENHYNTSELAYHVGFSDPKYFSKCFRRQFGKTPKEFLKSRMKSSVIED